MPRPPSPSTATVATLTVPPANGLEAVPAVVPMPVRQLSVLAAGPPIHTIAQPSPRPFPATHLGPAGGGDGGGAASAAASARVGAGVRPAEPVVSFIEVASGAEHSEQRGERELSSWQKSPPRAVIHGLTPVAPAC